MLSDHELNKFLADVIGQEVYEKIYNNATKPSGKDPTWIIKGSITMDPWRPDGVSWEPVIDHSQMALIEEWVQRSLLGYRIQTVGSVIEVTLWNEQPQMGSAYQGFARHRSKLRAFGEAVVKMKEGL